LFFIKKSIKSTLFYKGRISLPHSRVTTDKYFNLYKDRTIAYETLLEKEYQQQQAYKDDVTTIGDEFGCI